MKTQLNYGPACFSGVILVLVIRGFWASYFSRAFEQSNILVHLHAMSWTLWCVLVLVQAVAARRRHMGFHRLIGRGSPLLVVAVVSTTVALARQRLQGLEIAEHHLKVTAFNLATLAGFLTLYGLALVHRHNPSIHARYVLSALLLLFTAFVPRFIEEVPLLVGWSVWLFGGFVAIGQASLIPADACATAMLLVSRRARETRGVFLAALACFCAIHASPVVLSALPVWRVAVMAFAGAPPSWESP